MRGRFELRYDGEMKNPMLFVILFWILCAPLAAQERAAPVSPEAVLIELAYNGNLAAVQKLVEAGVSVEALNPDRSTPLMWSAYNGHTDIAAYLLEHGASIDAKDGNGRTALIYASSGPFPETVELLLNHGAEVNLQGTAEGFTALMMAAAEGRTEVVRLLLAHGARTDILDRDGDTAEKFARERGQAQVLELLAEPPTGNDPP